MIVHSHGYRLFHDGSLTLYHRTSDWFIRQWDFVSPTTKRKMEESTRRLQITVILLRLGVI